jgi:hypothetical protein
LIPAGAELIARGGSGHHERMPSIDEPGFEPFGFAPVYEVEINPEFPGDGDWRCEVVCFDRNAELVEAFDSRWGDPVIVRVVLPDDSSWVGMFPAGGLGGVTGVFACPSPHDVCVVAEGLAFLIDVRDPSQRCVVAHDQLVQVAASADPRLLVLVRFLDAVAIGEAGIKWKSARLCVDDLRLVEVAPHGLVFEGDNLGGSPTITVDPETGEQIAGSRIDWP